MTDLKSISFPNGVRGELLEFRQHGESADSGIPSDCDPHGTDMGDHPEVPYMLRAHSAVYPSSRYGNRTIHDVMAAEEMGPTHWQQEQAAWDRVRAWAAIGLGLFAFWGFVLWQVL